MASPPLPRKKSKKRENNSLPSSSTSCRRRRPTMAPPPQKRVRLEENHLLPPLLLPYIPDHVIFSRILPLLSSKNLEKLKLVCKSWCSFISSNPMLPLDRFLRHNNVSSSSSYSGVIFPECNSKGQLVFLPTTPPTLHGADPLDFFLSVSFSKQPCKELVASTDGLLCLKCSGNDNIIYVCNPLTKEGHVVPLSSNNSWHDRVFVWKCSSIGLAYDSLKSPAQYKLVRPWSQYFEEKDKNKVRIVFGFEVFSSQTNEWCRSYNKYYVEEEERNNDYFFKAIYVPRPHYYHFAILKSIYAGGVLYWDCIFHLMYFDPDKGYGGIVPLPFHSQQEEDEVHKIGEFKGHVTCYRLSMLGGMQLWILQDVNRGSTGGWELMHQVSFETVIKTNRYVFRTAFRFDKSLKRKDMLECMFHGWGVIPLPYGGDNGGRLFMRVIGDNVLWYDPNSGKLNKFCTLLRASYGYYTGNGHSFLYRSSMVGLPKLGKP